MDVLGLVAGEELMRIYSAACECGGMVRCIGGGTYPKFAYRCECGKEWQQIKPKDVAEQGLQKTPTFRNHRGSYSCKLCGQPKKGHICSKKPPKPVKATRVFKTSRMFESVRKNKQQRCSKCQQLGHNKAGCTFTL